MKSTTEENLWRSIEGFVEAGKELWWIVVPILGISLFHFLSGNGAKAVTTPDIMLMFAGAFAETTYKAWRGLHDPQKHVGSQQYKCALWGVIVISSISTLVTFFVAWRQYSIEEEGGHAGAVKSTCGALSWVSTIVPEHVGLVACVAFAIGIAGRTTLQYFEIEEVVTPSNRWEKTAAASILGGGAVFVAACLSSSRSLFYASIALFALAAIRSIFFEKRKQKNGAGL